MSPSLTPELERKAVSAVGSNARNTVGDLRVNIHIAIQKLEDQNIEMTTRRNNVIPSAFWDLPTAALGATQTVENVTCQSLREPRTDRSLICVAFHKVFRERHGPWSYRISQFILTSLLNAYLSDRKTADTGSSAAEKAEETFVAWAIGCLLPQHACYRL